MNRLKSGKDIAASTALDHFYRIEQRMREIDRKILCLSQEKENLVNEILNEELRRKGVKIWDNVGMGTMLSVAGTCKGVDFYFGMSDGGDAQVSYFVKTSLDRIDFERGEQKADYVYTYKPGDNVPRYRYVELLHLVSHVALVGLRELRNEHPTLLAAKEMTWQDG